MSLQFASPVKVPSSPVRGVSHRCMPQTPARCMPQTPALKRRKLNLIPAPQPTQVRDLAETALTQNLEKTTACFKKSHLGGFKPSTLMIGTRSFRVTEAVVVNLEWKELVGTKQKVYALYLVTIEGFQHAGIERFKDVTHCMMKFLNENKLINSGHSSLEILKQEMEDYAQLPPENSAPYLDFEILQNDGQFTPNYATHAFHLQEYMLNPNLEQIAICCGSAYRNVFVPFKVKIGSQTVTITEMIKPLGSGAYNDAYHVRIEGLPANTSDASNDGVLEASSSLIEESSVEHGDDSGDRDIEAGIADGSQNAEMEGTDCVIKFANQKMRIKPPEYREELLQIEMEQYLILRQHFPDNLALWADFEILINEGQFHIENVTHVFRIQEFLADYPVLPTQGNLDPEGSEGYQADTQLKKIIQTIYDNQLSCDLAYSNLGMDKNKKILLRDMIHPDEDVHSECGVKLNRSAMILDLINKGLRTLAPERSERYMYLDPRILKQKET